MSSLSPFALFAILVLGLSSVACGTASSDEWTVDRGFSDLETKQIVAALHESSHTDVTNVKEAFAAVDEETMNHVVFSHRATGKKYVAIEYGAGDNSYGAIFGEGSPNVTAGIHDGDISECR